MVKNINPHLGYCNSGFSECGPQYSCITITWELVWNANYPTLHQICWIRNSDSEDRVQQALQVIKMFCWSLRTTVAIVSVTNVFSESSFKYYERANDSTPLRWYSSFSNLHVKNHMKPGWYCSMDWAPASEPKGCQSIPGLGTCLGCRPGPQLGVCERQQMVMFLPSFLPPFPSLKIIKYFKKKSSEVFVKYTN